jgi:peptidyl-prolyl cis-trans isomerase C
VLPILLSSCGDAGERAGEGEGTDVVVARAGESVLTLPQLEAMIPPEYADSYGFEEERELVERWVETELIYQEALRRGLDRAPDIVSKVAEFRRLLLENELIEQELSSKIEITDADIEAYYHENRDLFTRERDQIRLSQIVVDSLVLAAALRERLGRQPDLFGELADQYSRDGSSNAGDVGYYPIDALVEPLSQAAAVLEVGAISPVVSVPGIGYFIIMVTDRKPAGAVRDLDDVADEIKEMILVSREETERERWVDELVEKSDMEVNWQLLEERFGE